MLGEPDAQRQRLEAFQEAGITTPVLLMVPGGGPGERVGAEKYVDIVNSLAPAGSGA